ncbi:mitochondrial ribonuclease P catalytic subunit [Ambystoma mexicanum]|uniref:mitochondrial ribonuclease P catalytic subunit n=1 Tax=Ambystoma mexicanum TaxID=8296 RepID=UPI0037E72B25
MALPRQLCPGAQALLQALIRGFSPCPRGHRPMQATFGPFCRIYASFTTSSKFPAAKDEETYTLADGAANKIKSVNANPQAFSVFSAGASKRRSEQLHHIAEQDRGHDARHTRLKGLLVPTHPLPAEEWEKLRDESFKPSFFENRMMDQMIASNSDINVAKSLLAFAAKESGGIEYKLLLKYLTLCVYQQQTAEISDVYDIMRARFKSLETGAYSLFIKAFSRLDRWQESLSLLELVKKTMTPSRRNYGDCIQGALLHQNADVAWALYSEMLRDGLMPHLDTLQAFFDAGQTLSDEHFNLKLLNVLEYLQDHQVYPGESFVHSIKSWFESIPGEKWEGRLTGVQNSGQCRSCGRGLESIQLKDEEYSTLKEAILTEVIQGKDTFRKTTPKELQEFRDFVHSCPAFDIVIDGLNVANITGRGCRSQILLDVLSSLAENNQRILVLGRKHMLTPSRSWDRRHMAIVQQRARCFFTDNISEDDPFLLYATMNSGNQCKFVTRDLLRDHKACLADSRIRRLFFKWQRGHQLVLPFYNPGKKVVFQTIASYDTVVQTTGDTWHVPYDVDGVERCTHEVPRKWLCLKRKA